MKAKTQKSLSKRVRITVGGAVMRKAAAVSHLRTNKSSRTTVAKSVHTSDVGRVRKMLPNG